MWIAFKILNTDNGKYNSLLPTLYFQLFNLNQYTYGNEMKKFFWSKGKGCRGVDR